MNRREFLCGMCYGGLATCFAPLACFASVPSRSRFVFVLLRGGFDGLAAIIPAMDPNYARLRGQLALRPDELAPLGETGFALAPGLSSLAELWNRNELAVTHAMAIPYRTRSHFDGQAILETGLARPEGQADGWLNRLLTIMGGKYEGLAVGAGLPRSMHGPHAVTTVSLTKLGAVTDAYLARLHHLYQRDPILLDRFETALQAQEEIDELGPITNHRGPVAPILDATAKFLRDPDGPNVAAVEFSGWDTHRNQGKDGGQLDRRLSQLAAGLSGFRRQMGEAWADTTVVVMTEFGRTVRPNGSNGTDHGTAGAGLILGPNLAKSAVVSDWPGLAEKDLYENRDLRPTLDTRAVLKGVIAGAFDLTTAQANRVFPGSDTIRPLNGIMR